VNAGQAMESMDVAMESTDAAMESLDATSQNDPAVDPMPSDVSTNKAAAVAPEATLVDMTGSNIKETLIDLTKSASTETESTALDETNQDKDSKQPAKEMSEEKEPAKTNRPKKRSAPMSDEKEPTKRPSRKRRNNSDDIVSDHNAALQCLVVLQCKFGNNPWPAKATGINSVVSIHAGSKATDDFATWIRKKEKVGQNVPTIRKRIVKLLVEMGAISKSKGGKYTWNRQRVETILQSCQSAGSTTVDQYAGPVTRAAAARAAASPARVASPNSAASPKRAALSDVCLVETIAQLESLEDTPPFKITSSDDDKTVIAVDCEGVPDNLFLIQVGTMDSTYVFDCVKLGPQRVCEFLSPMLTDARVTKLFHDLHNDAAAFANIGAINQLEGTLDTQLAMESLTGELHVGFNQLMKNLNQKQHGSKHVMKGRMQNGQLFAQRPLPRDVLKYAVDDVRLLIGAYDSLREKLGETWDWVQKASDLRARMAAASGGTRSICFDVQNAYAVASYELLLMLRPSDMMKPTPLQVSNETETLISLLPEDLSSTLNVLGTRQLSDVVLDKGRRPLAWIGGSRLLLGDENRLVEPDEIATVVEKLGGFGSDNRSGLERQLHRISAIRNRESEIIGLTLRIGRHVSGNTGIISDLLFGDPTKSILFLGEPGAGYVNKVSRILSLVSYSNVLTCINLLSFCSKTTIVREVTRLLSERSNVCIVDTSNEIAGDGDIPHPCVGFARRMMVPSLDQQSSVMIECVQNHTPEVMIIDEIGRPTEVEAARTCKNRGVRLIASAHGDLRKLIKNPKLRGLIGGVETVTLGDAQARAEAKKNPGGTFQKTKAERAGPPTFDILVELKRGAHHEWKIVLDAGDAVDRVLRGEEYKVQRRTRNPETGELHLDLGMA
jgi:stage III sporulation protein SpoIIIAA